jgi:23S rRNA pseudoU1915 N3-methylase RlmH
LGNEKRKSGLKELQENYGKRLNDCILKNTDLRTNIAQLEDEKILLEQRNANIENNSAEDIDSQIDSGIDSVFLGSAISGGMFDSQIVPLTIGNFKRKNNNFV